MPYFVFFKILFLFRTNSRSVLLEKLVSLKTSFATTCERNIRSPGRTGKVRFFTKCVCRLEPKARMGKKAEWKIQIFRSSEPWKFASLAEKNDIWLFVYTEILFVSGPKKSYPVRKILKGLDHTFFWRIKKRSYI